MVDYDIQDLIRSNMEYFSDPTYRSSYLYSELSEVDIMDLHHYRR